MELRGKRIGTTGDVARSLGVCNAWVLRGLMASGVLPPLARTVGGQFLFDMQAVDGLREQRRAQQRRTRRRQRTELVNT